MTKFLTALGVVLIAAALLAGMYLGWQAWTAHSRAALQSASAEAAQKAVATQAQSGRAAVQATQAQAQFEAGIHQQTEESRRAITQAPGAEAPVQPAVYNVALREHCRRASARHDPMCAALRVHGS